MAAIQIVLLAALLARWLVALHPHSGTRTARVSMEIGGAMLTGSSRVRATRPGRAADARRL